MHPSKKLQSLLIKSGLKPDEACFYLFVLNNPGCSIANIYKKSTLSKSSAYRAFEALKTLELLTSASDSWKTNLQTISLSGLIKKLESQQKKRQRLIHELKFLNHTRKLTGHSRLASIETFTGEEIYENYLELSQMNFNTLLVYGNWEDFNHDGRDLLPLEKKFIRTRVKKGSNALAFLTKTGTHTREVTDYDISQNRISKLAENPSPKPIWINAFEGNNLVSLWNLGEKNQIYSTLIDSKPVADFYKEFIYSQIA